MTVRQTAITGLFLSALIAAGCQNAMPQFGQSDMGAGLFGPHVAAQQPQYGGDPFLNSERSQGSAMNSGHVRVAGMQPPPGQATSNVSPTIIQADYRQPAVQGGYPQTTLPAGYQQTTMPAGYQQPAGPFAPAATMPVNNPGWHSSQSPVYTKSY
jgi:hypothetical protein